MILCVDNSSANVYDLTHTMHGLSSPLILKEIIRQIKDLFFETALI